MTETLSAIAGIIISLALSYIPGVEARWKALDGSYKRVYLAGALALAGLVIGAFGEASWPEIGRGIVWALIASQSAYTFTPTADRRTPDQHPPVQ
jgi:hypothetical protein